MGQVKVAGFSVSLDGFGAGPEQNLQHPPGLRGKEIHGWFVETKTGKVMFGGSGKSDGVYGVVESIASERATHVILGRQQGERMPASLG